MGGEVVVEDWRQVFRDSTYRCPQCGQIWLLMGMRDNETYTCRSCGCSFATDESNRAGEKAVEEDRIRPMAA